MENWKGIRRVVGTLSRWRVKSVPVGHWGECPSIVGSGFRRADFGGTLGHGEMAGEKDREWQPRTSNAQRLKQRVAFVARMARRVGCAGQRPRMSLHVRTN